MARIIGGDGFADPADGGSGCAFVGRPFFRGVAFVYVDGCVAGCVSRSAVVAVARGRRDGVAFGLCAF